MQIQIQFFTPYYAQDKGTIRDGKEKCMQRYKISNSKKFQDSFFSLRSYSGVRSLEWSSYFFCSSHNSGPGSLLPFVNLSGKKRSSSRSSFEFTWWFSIRLWSHRMALPTNKYYMWHRSGRMQNHLFLHCPICISIAFVWNMPLGVFRSQCD